VTESHLVLAPAKLNFGLRIVGIRPDGYHLLESLFVPVALADRLSIEILGEGAGEVSEIELRVSCDEALPGASGIPETGENLVVRAARAFLTGAGLRADLSIRLEKLVPAGAGMGGGSSDAGAILRFLAERYPDAFSKPALIELAAKLGADVPFFLARGPSWVGGVGEQVVGQPDFPPVWVVLANPGVSLATAEVFANFDREPRALTLPSTSSTMRALSELAAEFFSSDSGARIRGGDNLDDGITNNEPLDPLPEMAPGTVAKAFDSGLLENDLETAAINLCPGVANLQQRLGEVGARWTGMSGSGATVYGIFVDEDSARRGLRQAEFQAPIWACVTQTQGGAQDQH
jgi:4-diphosphocytidyl-2-C-methyl-D-erythritol kinase